MKEFEVEVGAMVTIHETEVFCMKANSLEEAQEKAAAAFKKWLEEKYSYVDYDEVYYDTVSETEL